MAVNITDELGDRWAITRIDCRACHHVIEGDENLARIVDVDEACPQCGDGALLFGGDAIGEERLKYEEVTVTYDLDDEVTWGYSYGVLRDEEGRYWFGQDQVEQYAQDWDEVDGIDFGVHLDHGGTELRSAGYWRPGVTGEVPVVMLRRWETRSIDGHPHWEILGAAWRPVTDADFADFRED
jgi:hypothetical protein